MKLIVGLGNPGKKYEKSRHNIGFMFLSSFAKTHNVINFQSKFKGLIGSYYEGNEQVLLLMPQTYMNLSGESVKEVVDYYKIDLKDVLVVYDDKDVPFAKLRLREKGNPGSHNGMKNITELLNSNEFKRMRVGMGCPIANSDMINFVLGDFSKEELKELEGTFIEASKASDLFVLDKFNEAMNTYNYRKSND